MKEDLGMAQGDLSNIVSTYTAGYCLAQIPSTLMLLVIRPSYWFPLNGVGWAILTCCCAVAKNSNTIYAIRFLQGMFESVAFSGAMFVLGSWYKPEELTKRTALFCISGHLGSVSASLIQSAIHSNLNGVTSLATWQLMFVIDGVIVFPVVVYGFLCFPDLPNSTKAWYLTQEERELAVNRLPPSFDVSFTPEASKETFKRTVGNWHIYVLTLLFAVGNLPEGYGMNNAMSLWLKGLDYSVTDANNYGTGVYGVAAFTTLLASYIADKWSCHWVLVCFMGVLDLVTSIIIVIYPRNMGVLYFAFYLSGTAYLGQSVIFSWANIICKRDPVERLIVLTSMNLLSFIFNIWWNVTAFSSQYAIEEEYTPYNPAAIGCIASVGIYIPMTFLTLYLHRKQNRTDEVAEIIDKVKSVTSYSIDKDDLEKSTI
ncbi:MFS general substrate transporter [Wallemia mellicola]|nr:MFS general substrate transporter [Wallemia mellicola]